MRRYTQELLNEATEHYLEFVDKVLQFESEYLSVDV